MFSAKTLIKQKNIADSQKYLISVLLNRVSSNFKVYSGAGFTLLSFSQMFSFQPTQFIFFVCAKTYKPFYLTPPIQRTYAREMGNGLIRQ